MLTVSIVSYRNKKDLVSCIDSIIKTIQRTEYEILVLLYLFDKNDAAELKNLYKDDDRIRFIDNNEFAGFAENHNILLRQARGTECLVLNDDTYFTDDSIDKMVDLLHSASSIDILSPVIYNIDGTVQISGRRRYSFINWLMDSLKLTSILSKSSKYENGNGLFRTYNISGSCVLIRTEVLVELGYFDEKFFFMPEDIAFSEKANRLEKGVFVDTNSKIYHINSSTTRPMFQVTIPVAKLGIYLFFRNSGGYLLEFLTRLLSFLISAGKLATWTIGVFDGKQTNSKKIMRRVHFNVMRHAFVYKYTTKELFVKLYKSEIKP